MVFQWMQRYQTERKEKTLWDQFIVEYKAVGALEMPCEQTHFFTRGAGRSALGLGSSLQPEDHGPTRFKRLLDTKHTVASQ